jgi:hypothetical protein
MTPKLPDGWTMIPLEQFENLPARMTKHTKQYSCLLALPVGKAVLLTHDNYKCPRNIATKCNLYTLAKLIAKKRGLTADCRHLEDKRIAIAFYGKEP